MLRKIFVAFVCLTLGFFSAAGWAETVRLAGDDLIRDTTTTYLVEHSDGTKEKLVLKYEGQVAYKTWQTGSVSKPLSGKIKDDRKCHFSADVRVFRRAYIATHSGALASLDSYQAVYHAHQYTDRGADNGWEALTRHVTCGEVNLFRDRVEQAKSDLIAQFDQLVAQDDDKARERLKQLLHANKITRVTNLPLKHGR